MMFMNIFRFLFETVEIVVIALLIVVPIRYFVFQPFFVRGQSMEPSFHDGDYLVVDELTYRFREPQRGEVIVFKYPQNTSQRYIKRIIGLPGETVEIKGGTVFIESNGQRVALQENEYLGAGIDTPGEVKISLGPGEYFVLGDNRYASSDSRRWGILPREDIIGRVLLRAWPPSAFAYIEAPSY
jgi:signal peptidase I